MNSNGFIQRKIKKHEAAIDVALATVAAIIAYTITVIVFCL